MLQHWSGGQRRGGEITGVKRTSDEIRCRRWNWIGHIMRKNREEHFVTALEWWPEERRRDHRSGVNRTSDEIRRRRWNWIGHIMRKNRD